MHNVYSWLRGTWRSHPRICAVVALAIASASSYIYFDAKALSIQRALWSELQMIAPPPNAVVIEKRSMHKPGATYIEIVYSCPMDFSEISGHYDLQLRSNGWHSIGVRTLEPDIEEIQFCKGLRAFKLYHYTAGSWHQRFWIDIDWGLNACRSF